MITIAPSPEIAQMLASLRTFAERVRQLDATLRHSGIVFEVPRPPVVRGVFTPEMIERILK